MLELETSPVRNLLFDLDGTLINSAPGILFSMKDTLAKLSLEIPETEYASCLGPPLRSSLTRYFRIARGGSAETPSSEFDPTPDELEQAVTLFRAHYDEHWMERTPFYDGIGGALSELRARGYRLRIATSKPRKYAEQILVAHSMDRLFDGIYGSALTGELSEKPELIAHILAHDSLESRETRMIGDRKHDIIGGLANGVETLGVLWGYGSHEELTKAGAHGIVSTIEELIERHEQAPIASPKGPH